MTPRCPPPGLGFCSFPALAIILFLSSAGAADPSTKPASWKDQPVGDEGVRAAIHRGVDYLWSCQDLNEFHFERQTDKFWRKWRAEMQKGRNRDVPLALSPGGLRGGRTALALLALLKSGADAKEPRFAKAVAWLKDQPLDHNYAWALRACLLSSLPNPGENRVDLVRHARWLQDAMFSDGTYGYRMPSANTRSARPVVGPDATLVLRRDLSNMQYALLGMWMLADAGCEIPGRYWSATARAWLASQLKGGAWPYVYGDTSRLSGTQSMTLAGLASLYVVWDHLHRDCKTMPSAELVGAVEEGLQWLAKNFDPAAGSMGAFNQKFRLYTLYGVERVGVASGLKYFGEHNWWKESAQYILWSQRADGSWPDDMPALVDETTCGDPYAMEVVGGPWGFLAEPRISTAYALLVLSYGRAPVVFNKLAYGATAQWNTRPRDLAHLTQAMGRTYEHLFNWQITPIDRPVDELSEAPILVMSGKTAINLTADQKARLKDYVLRGGLLLGDAADHSPPFANAFRALARELFPGQEVVQLATDHPIYNAHFRLQPGPSGPPPIEGVSNGVRTMVMLSPRDLGCDWQFNRVSTSRPSFELACNIMEYASDRAAGLIGRGASYATKDAGNKPDRTVTIGRLAWAEAPFVWDPEPAGWPRMDVLLRNRDLASIATQKCELAEALDPKKTPILHITGTTEFHLKDAQKTNLSAYVAAGGLVLADAAGGSKAFAESFVKVATELWGPMGLPTAAWLPDATEKDRVWLRHVDGLPRAQRPSNLSAWSKGKGEVLLLPYDLSAAMVGYPSLAPVGLTPDAAERFVAALVKWAAEK